MSKPTESYVLRQRLFTFFDEWMFYILLVWLHVNNYAIMWLVAPIGAAMVVYSYTRLWKLEAQIFEE